MIGEGFAFFRWHYLNYKDSDYPVGCLARPMEFRSCIYRWLTWQR